MQITFSLPEYLHLVDHYKADFASDGSGKTPRIPADRVVDEEVNIWAHGTRVSRKMTSSVADKDGSSNVEERIIAFENDTHILYMVARLAHVVGSISRNGRSRLLQLRDIRYELAKKILVQPETSVQTN